MAVNEKLIRTVVRAIELEPGRWDQGEWSGPRDSCQTKFCFAGWAMNLEGMVDEAGDPNLKALARADALGLALDLQEIAEYPGSYFPWSEVAADLLGLNSRQASILFDSEAGDGKWGTYLGLLSRETGIQFAHGTIGVDTQGLETLSWFTTCSICGEVYRSQEGTAEAHDDAVRYWAYHEQTEHGGDGVVATDMLMLGE